MEETVQLTTPNGYVATIKSGLTYGQYEDIQNAIIGDNIQLDAQGKPIINIKTIQAANQKTLELLLIKIEKDGVVFTGTIRDLPKKDGQAIMNRINEVTKDDQPDVKKGI